MKKILFLILFSSFLFAQETAMDIPQLDTDFYSNSGGNLRIWLKAAGLIASGSEVRILIKGHSSGEMHLLNCSIGLRDADDDFAATPTPVTFSGASTVSVTTTFDTYDAWVVSAGDSVWSDWITFDFDSDNNYLIHFYFWGGVHDIYSMNLAGYADAALYYQLGNLADETMALSITDPSYTATVMYFIQDIEVRTVVTETDEEPGFGGYSGKYGGYKK